MVNHSHHHYDDHVINSTLGATTTTSTISSPTYSQHDHHAQSIPSEGNFIFKNSFFYLYIINLGSSDHSGHENQHQMLMFFHGGNNEIVLFDCWKIGSNSGNLFFLNYYYLLNY